MNNYAGFEQLLRGFDPRNIVIPKNFECFEKPCHVAGCSLKVEINISSEPRITMKDDGFTPNNEVTDLEPAEQSDEFKHITRATLIRSAGVIPRYWANSHAAASRRFRLFCTILCIETILTRPDDQGEQERG